MASTTTPKGKTTPIAAQRAAKGNAGKGTSRKAPASKTSTSTKKGTDKVRQIDIIAKVITGLGGKAKLADVAKVVESKKLIDNLGPYTYRKLYGIILRDKGQTVAKAGKGEFKVVTKKS